MRASILLLRPAKDKVEILVEAFNGDHLIPGVVVTDKNTNYRQQLRSGLQQRYGSTSLLEMLDKARKLRPHSKAMQSVYYIAIAQPSFAVETKKAALGFVELTPSLSKAIDCAESADVVFTVWQELCAHKPTTGVEMRAEQNRICNCGVKCTLHLNPELTVKCMEVVMAVVDHLQDFWILEHVSYRTGSASMKDFRVAVDVKNVSALRGSRLRGELSKRNVATYTT